MISAAFQRHVRGIRHRVSMPEEPRLTPRELDVMWLVASDRTSKEIGRILLISPRTVEMHVRSSMRKLGCATRAGAVWRLASLGVLPRSASTREEPPDRRLPLRIATLTLAGLQEYRR